MICLFLVAACSTFLLFRLDFHGLPVALDCTFCGGHSVGDKMHMDFECSFIQSLRARYANFYIPDTDSMHRLDLSGQQARKRLFENVLDCLVVHKMVGL